MVVKHRISKRCPICGDILTATVDKDVRVKYICENCKYKEIEEKPIALIGKPLPIQQI